MKALQVYAGPRALAHLRQHGLAPAHVRTIPAAAGGPKGLSLLPLDRFLFGEWLPRSEQTVDLIGASIGAWRMAAAALDRPADAIAALEHAYIHQDYDLPPGRKSPSREHISERFAHGIHQMFDGRVTEVLAHSRYRLHVMTSRGRHLLGRDQWLRSPLGYAGAFFTNVASRKAMSAWLERAVFSAPAVGASALPPLPFATGDYRTRRYGLTAQNFAAVVQASCSIPFVLNAVHDIPGAARGAYWDGGITDYHLHLDYGSALDAAPDETRGVVLYPHFQRAVVPGWLDKSLKWRHGATHFLDDVIVLAPSADWVATLPNGKLPDRTDFTRYGRDLKSRVAAWSRAVAESQRLRDEFAAWVEAGGSADAVRPLGR
ncbi:MAG: phospholipase [Burkholderiales bacterium]|nr:phospholipase [Burkholderiales bacterium]